MKNPTPYLKMRVLGAIDMAEGSSIQARIKAVSQMTFTDEDGHPRQFTWRTIQTWYSRYQKHGVTVVENKTRSDKGKTRKVSLEMVQEAIDTLLPKIRGVPKHAVLYRLCIEQGLLTRAQVAPRTFSRVVKQCDMLKPQADSDNKQRLAFAKAHANEMWQADTLIGPYVHIGGTPVQTRLIAFLDDASRVCCHGQFFPAENVDTLIQALRAAFYKRGVPACLYVDNGSIYTSKEIIQICARVGCLLAHAPVRDGAAKGKVERFFRGVREQFLCRQLDLSSLEALNRQFTHWVEEDYNAHLHSVLGMSPLDRFALDRSRIRFLPPNEANDELFSSRKTATSAPITPSLSMPYALKLHATCPSVRSKCASNAKTPPRASSSITKANAWERPARWMPSPTTDLPKSQSPTPVRPPAPSPPVPKTLRPRLPARPTQRLPTLNPPQLSTNL